MDAERGRGPLGFKIIGAFKVACAALFLAAGVGLLRHLDDGADTVLLRAVALLKLDPGNHYIHTVISRASGISRGQLKAIGFGTFFYAALYAVEGIGLLVGARWASYLTVVATGALIPLEIYEVAERSGPVKILILVLNIAITVYVIWKLVQERRAGRA